jgi:hypothetical protein
MRVKARPSLDSLLDQTVNHSGIRAAEIDKVKLV